MARESSALLVLDSGPAWATCFSLRLDFGNLCGICGLCTGAGAPFARERDILSGAALGIPYATASRALFQRGRVRAGESVFVHGASGGVGTAAVQLARTAEFGCSAPPAPPRVAIGRELGAARSFRPQRSGYREAIR